MKFFCSLGAFGGTIIANGFKTSDINLYCTRPGLRIWEADIEGNVLKTLLFKVFKQSYFAIVYKKSIISGFT